jgi:hypothetical protein
MCGMWNVETVRVEWIDAGKLNVECGNCMCGMD